jgi:hypothetical protein
MSVVSTILTAVGYRKGGGTTISTTSDPNTATCVQWLNEIALWITGICAENDSDLGRTIGTITTIYAPITAATKAADCEITAASHGLMSSGTAEVLVRSVVGMTELNDTEFTATYVSANAVTLGVASTDYTTYSSGGYVTKRKYGDFTTMYAPAQKGWIVDGHSRNPIRLRDETCLAEYDPVEATEPYEFYVDGANNICFPSYPDDAYTVKIPYWYMPTAMVDGTSTVPFLGLMDNLFIEALAIRAFDRDEYDINGNLKWQSFISERAVRVIAMRKSMQSRVST